MVYPEDFVNRIVCGHTLDVLKQMPDGVIDCCITSPPYWGLRTYKTEPVIWDSSENCQHEWGKDMNIARHKEGETNPGKEGWYKDKGQINSSAGNFCQLCGAWRGELGLEPAYNDSEIEIEIMKLKDNLTEEEKKEVYEYFGLGVSV